MARSPMDGAMGIQNCRGSTVRTTIPTTKNPRPQAAAAPAKTRDSSRLQREQVGFLRIEEAIPASMREMPELP